MIIYGRRSIKEALQNNLDIQKVFVKKNAKNLEKIIFELNRKKIPISFVPLVKLDKLTKGNHQGVVCQVSPIKTKSLEDLDEFLQNSTIVKILILDGVTDTRNFGSIIRNAECFGVDGIIISKTGSAPINDEVVKTSSGAIFNIQIFKVDHLIDAILILKDQKFTILGADEKSMKSLTEIKIEKKTAIILGSEGKGISYSVLKNCDERFKIPITGKIESLNVAVASGIILYAISKASENFN